MTAKNNLRFSKILSICENQIEINHNVQKNHISCGNILNCFGLFLLSISCPWIFCHNHTTYRCIKSAPNYENSRHKESSSSSHSHTRCHMNDNYTFWTLKFNFHGFVRNIYTYNIYTSRPLSAYLQLQLITQNLILLMLKII